MIARLICRLWGHDRLELVALFLSPDDPRYALALTCQRCGRR